MIKTFLKTLVVVPSLIFICEGTIPNTLALAPRVSHVDELETLHIGQVSHLEHTVSLVELNTLGTVALNWLVIIVHLIVFTDNDEALLVRLL